MYYNYILNLKSVNLANLSDEKVLHALHTQKRVAKMVDDLNL